MTAQVEKKEIGNLVIEGIPEIPVKLSERLNQYQNTREAFLIDWLRNDQGLLIKTRFGESVQYHTVERAGGIRRQLTFFDVVLRIRKTNSKGLSNSKGTSSIRNILIIASLF